MTDHYRLASAGDSVRIGVPSGTRPEDEPRLAYWFASHAGEAIEVTRYDAPPPAPVPVRRPTRPRRPRGPQMEMRL